MSLPSDTEAYMVHRSPMRLAKRLLCVGENDAEGEAFLEKGDVGVGPDGKVEAAALLEMVVQTYAAAQGYRNQAIDKPPSLGYLVGASDFWVEHVPSAGQRLLIKVKSSRPFENFYLIEGQVICEGRVLAGGTLKAWVQPETEQQAE